MSKSTLYMMMALFELFYLVISRGSRVGCNPYRIFNLCGFQQIYYRLASPTFEIEVLLIKSLIKNQSKVRLCYDQSVNMKVLDSGF